MTYVQPGNAAGPYATPHPWQPNEETSGPQVLLRVADLNRELAVGPRPQSPVQLAPVHNMPQRPAERPATPPVSVAPAVNVAPPVTVAPAVNVAPTVTAAASITVAPAADPTMPQTTISAAVMPSVSESDTTVTSEVQPPAPTLAVLASTLAHTTDAPAAPAATAAPTAAVTVPAQHRPLPFLSSFLLSSRRRQLVTFSLAVMALLVLFRAPGSRSVDQKATTDSTTQRENPPRRVAEGNEAVGESEWATGIPANPKSDERTPNGTTSPAGWTQSANETPAPTAPVHESQPTADQSASHASDTEPAPQVDLSGMDYPVTDPATYQYPANAHDLIISMLARDHAGH